MTEPLSQPCSIAVLTAAGRGAIASISVRGGSAPQLVDRFFRPACGAPLNNIPAGQVVFGHWEVADRDGEEVVVCRKSSTEVEIHCHGGRAATCAIVAGLQAAGAVVDGPAAWLAQKVTDPLARAARRALAEALTTRAACTLLDQYRGGLRGALRETRDFIEREQIADAIARLGKLLQYGELGNHLTRPWRVTFAGPPNVGKSSLINAILGYQRSIVLDTPGTTRDVVTAVTALDGWPVEMIDTAGLRASDDEIEIEGVARARKQVASADLVVHVEDATQVRLPCQAGSHSAATRHLKVYNKCDLLTASSSVDIHGLTTSAVTGTGIDALTSQIINTLVPERPEPGEAIPFEPTQVDSIRHAFLALQQGDSDAAREVLAELLDD
jgi:tRNA modification GTPase